MWQHTEFITYDNSFFCGLEIWTRYLYLSSNCYVSLKGCWLFLWPCLPPSSPDFNYQVLVSDTLTSWSLFHRPEKALSCIPHLFSVSLLGFFLAPSHSVTKGIRVDSRMGLPHSPLLGEGRRRAILWLRANKILSFEGTRKALFRYQGEIKAKKYKQVFCLRQAESHHKGAPHLRQHSRCSASERLPQNK